MEHESSFEPTVFDTLTQTREIQMLKTAIPYMKQTRQKEFAMIIKYLELQKAFQIFSSPQANLSACELSNDQNNSMNLLNELRKYATPKELETIDSLTNLLSLISLYTDYS